MCFEETLPCPLRGVFVRGTVAEVLAPAADDDIPAPVVGDELVLLGYANSSVTRLEMVQDGVFRVVGVEAGSPLPLNSTHSVAAFPAVGGGAALLSRVAANEPVVQYKVALNGQVCFGADQDVSVGYSGPGQGGINDYSELCANVDERWFPAAKADEVTVLRNAFDATTLCTSRVNDTGFQQISCADCDFIPNCRSVACPTMCDRLQTFLDETTDDLDADETEEGLQTETVFSMPSSWTVMARRETYWRSDCSRSRDELVAVLEPLKEVRDTQEDVATAVTVLSGITIVTSLLMFLTMRGQGLTCFGKTNVTQRVVIAFYSTCIALVVNAIKVVLVVLVTMVIGRIRAFFYIFAVNESDACSGEETNETMAALGRSLASAFDNNVRAVATDSLMLLAAMYTIFSEATDGEPLCEKGMPK